MSATRNTLASGVKIANAQSMGASVTSSVVPTSQLYLIGIQADYTGTPTGTLAVEVSADYQQDLNGNVLVAGTWTTLTSAALAGTAGATYFDIIETSAPWMRLKYTRASGTGTLNAYATGKGW